MKIGFIGLGNVGGKLSGSLLRNGFDLTVRDVDKAVAEPFLAQGAGWAESPKVLAEMVDVVITCLPSPVIVSQVMEADDGVLAGLGPDKIWLEMSTTDEAEVKRIGAQVEAQGATPMDTPVSGGCHRAATGKHLHLCGGGTRRFRARAAHPHGHGTRHSAYGWARVGLGAQGRHQLSRLCPSGGGGRGPHSRPASRHGSQHRL